MRSTGGGTTGIFFTGSIFGGSCTTGGGGGGGGGFTWFSLITRASRCGIASSLAGRGGGGGRSGIRDAEQHQQRKTHAQDAPIAQARLGIAFPGQFKAAVIGG